MLTFHVENFTDCLSIRITSISQYQTNNISGEHKDFKNSNTPEILKYISTMDHIQMRTDLNSRNWNQILGGVQNIENARDSFTKVLIDTAKKASIPLH